MTALGVTVHARTGGWVYLRVGSRQPLACFGFRGWALLRPKFMLLATVDRIRRSLQAGAR